MSHAERDPSNVAARYRVQRLGEGRFELRDKQDSLSSFIVEERPSISISFKIAPPHKINWLAL